VIPPWAGASPEIDQISITVKLFAIYQEVYGVGELRWTFASGSPVAAVLDRVIQEHPELEPWRDLTSFGVNLAVVDPSLPMTEGDEVVLLPPVSGG
jgi:molybdopterin synthase sulfur carrier subunit